MLGYEDHADCLADLQNGYIGDKLDCLGIYPQVLSLDVLGEKRQNVRDRMARQTQAELIYWGWNLHLYVDWFLFLLLLLFLLLVVDVPEVPLRPLTPVIWHLVHVTKKLEFFL